MKRATHISITNAGLRSIDRIIGAATNLRYLNVQGNEIRELTDMSNIRQLEVLNLYNNKLTAVHASIGTLSGLELLDVGSNDLTELPAEMKRLKKIDTLNASSNRLTAFPYMTRGCCMVEVNLDSNMLAAFPIELCYLLNLERIYMSGNNITSIPDEIKYLKKLNILKLKGNVLKEIPAGFRKLSSLQYLDLDENAFGEVPRVLFELPKLRCLSMSHNRITKFPHEFESESTCLDILYLSHNELTEFPAVIICELRYLSELELSNNRIRSLPPRIGNLVHLQNFFLANNELVELPPEIGMMGQLSHLKLEGNRLRSLPVEIGCLDMLGTLSLQNNELESLPATIVDMRWLEHIYLDNNPLVIDNAEVRAFIRGLENDGTYPGGIAFEIHNAFANINVDKYIAAISSEVAAPYRYMSSAACMKYIVTRLSGFVDAATALEGLKEINERILRRVDYSDTYKKLIYYTLEYVALQPAEFRHLYVSNFVYDNVNAYGGSESGSGTTFSCPKGTIERLVTSLVPSMMLYADGCEGAGASKYNGVLSIILNRGDMRVEMETCAKECYDECGGDKASFRALMLKRLGSLAAVELDVFISELGLF